MVVVGNSKKHVELGVTTNTGYHFRAWPPKSPQSVMGGATPGNNWKIILK